MKIEIIKKTITVKELKKVAEGWFGNMVKAVVDVETKALALGGEMHADAEEMMLENGSKQENLWGVNIYPFEKKEKLLQYTALINIRPREGNRDMEIQDNNLKLKIKNIIESKIL